MGIMTTLKKTYPRKLWRGGGQSLAIGHSRRWFAVLRPWGEQKRRRHLAKARQRQGCGGQRWRRRWRYDACGLFGADEVPWVSSTNAAPAREGASPVWRHGQERVVRESRRRRARRWGLDTERGHGLRHRHAAKAAGKPRLPGPTATAPVLDPTRGLGGQEERLYTGLQHA
jgi:hypothetical protein